MKFKYILLIFFLLFMGCHSDKRPDVSKLLKDRKILRFDRDVFALDKEQPDVKKMREKYGAFLRCMLPVYCNWEMQMTRNFPDCFHCF